MVEAENEKYFEHVVWRILEFREKGDACLETDFAVKYTSSKGGGRENKPYAHLMDLANMLFNWLEYTQLEKRKTAELLFFLTKKRKLPIYLPIFLPLETERFSTSIFKENTA